MNALRLVGIFFSLANLLCSEQKADGWFLAVLCERWDNLLQENQILLPWLGLGSEDAEVSQDCQSDKVLTTFNKENGSMKGEKDRPSLHRSKLRLLKFKVSAPAKCQNFISLSKSIYHRIWSWSMHMKCYFLYLPPHPSKKCPNRCLIFQKLKEKLIFYIF